MQARPSFEDILVILNTGATPANDLHQWNTLASTCCDCGYFCRSWHSPFLIGWSTLFNIVYIYSLKSDNVVHVVDNVAGLYYCHKKIAVSVSELKRFPIVTRKWTLLQGWHEESKLLRTCSILNFLPWTPPWAMSRTDPFLCTLSYLLWPQAQVHTMLYHSIAHSHILLAQSAEAICNMWHA